MKWLPIESAPSEVGARALISNGVAVGEAVFHGEHGWYWANTDPTDYYDGKVYSPTHFMPLPPPPGADDAG